MSRELYEMAWQYGEFKDSPDDDETMDWAAARIRELEANHFPDPTKMVEPTEQEVEAAANAIYYASGDKPRAIRFENSSEERLVCMKKAKAALEAAMEVRIGK